MQTVMIAHRDQRLVADLAAALRRDHYRVIDCPGPWPPAMRCIRCDVGYCPLTEGADVVVYDPDMYALDKEGQPYNLAIDTARAHPDVPMLLVWRGAETPAGLSDVLAQAPQAVAVSAEPDTFIQQVRVTLRPS